jgi:hypothetical protein
MKTMVLTYPHNRRMNRYSILLLQYSMNCRLFQTLGWLMGLSSWPAGDGKIQYGSPIMICSAKTMAQSAMSNELSKSGIHCEPLGGSRSRHMKHELIRLTLLFLNIFILLFILTSFIHFSFSVSFSAEFRRRFHFHIQCTFSAYWCCLFHSTGHQGPSEFSAEDKKQCNQLPPTTKHLP